MKKSLKGNHNATDQKRIGWGLETKDCKVQYTGLREKTACGS
jgi:hypothetical protein